LIFSIQLDATADRTVHAPASSEWMRRGAVLCDEPGGRRKRLRCRKTHHTNLSSLSRNGGDEIVPRVTPDTENGVAGDEVSRREIPGAFATRCRIVTRANPYSVARNGCFTVLCFCRSIFPGVSAGRTSFLTCRSAVLP